MIGQLLGGRYQVLHTLGAGSFGQTYLAEDIHRPEKIKCVVKQLKPVSKDPGFLPTARQLFRREAETLEKLGSHEQIPQLLAYFEEAQEFYLVQDYIEGQVLRHELLPGRPWSEDQVIRFLRDVLQILEFVHGYGVIHRDLKPDNLIRRQQDGKLVLIDFGAVKQVQMVLVGGLTPAGTPLPGTISIGTPGYMPPEQTQGRPRPASDLYALGIIAIQALTGLSPTQLPQDSRGEFEWQEQAQVNSGLAAVLNRMVRYYFQERYQSASDVLQALQQAQRAPSLLTRMGQLLRTPIGSRRPTSEPKLPPAPTSAKVMPELQNQREFQRDHSPILYASQPLQPSASNGCKVFISYRSQSAEAELARQFYAALRQAGHEPFLAGSGIQTGEGWAQRIDQALKQCDYFLLLLSPQSAGSEMVLEEVRTVKQLHDSRPDHRPVILPIRVDFPTHQPLNYELRGYLHRMQQRFWRSPTDTPVLVQEVLALLTGTAIPPSIQTAAASGSGSQPTVPPVEDDPAIPPLPVAEPELPEGQVTLASTFYIERSPIESRCRETIEQPGALIRIKAPRQMGKTSLMARILHHAAQQGHHTVPLSLQLADGNVFGSLDQFLRWLCASVGRRLRLPNKMADYWDDIFGSKYNCTAYFEEYLLPQLDSPLTLGLDEVDRVFEYPELANDFFGLLRAWHEEAKNQVIWQRLRLIVVHATEVYIPLNANQSPFNVGLPIELPEFNGEQVNVLAQRHGLAGPSAVVDPLLKMVGGHPYLVRLALYHIARGDTTLEQLLAEAATETSLFRDHLRGLWWNLQHHPELAVALQTLVEQQQPVDLEPTVLFKLHSLGLIKLEGNTARLRCELYHQYFSRVSLLAKTVTGNAQPSFPVPLMQER